VRNVQKPGGARGCEMESQKKKTEGGEKKEAFSERTSRRPEMKPSGLSEGRYRGGIPRHQLGERTSGKEEKCDFNTKEVGIEGRSIKMVIRMVPKQGSFNRNTSKMPESTQGGNRPYSVPALKSLKEISGATGSNYF